MAHQATLLHLCMCGPHSVSSPFRIWLKETSKQNTLLSPFYLHKPSCHCRGRPKRLQQEIMTKLVPPFKQESLILTANDLGPSADFRFVNSQAHDHSYTLTWSVSRHHTHPFMVYSKSEKGSRPSTSPTCSVWKLELSAKAPGTLQHKNIFYTYLRCNF